MPSVCYFELPVEDMAASQAFYNALFNWEFNKLDDGPGNDVDYHTINTHTPEGEGIPWGGMMKKQRPAHRFTPYMNVEAIEPYLQKAQALNAKVMVPKTTIPGKGYFAIFLDPENNPMGLWVTDESAQ